MTEMEKNQNAMKCDKSFIAASLLLVLTILIFLFAFVGDELLCWIEGHPGLAAWMQAIFAIGSIWAVFLVAKINYNKEKRDEIIVNELIAQLEIAQVWSQTVTTSTYLKNLNKKYEEKICHLPVAFQCRYFKNELHKIQFPSSELAKIICKFDVVFANHIIICICAKKQFEDNANYISQMSDIMNISETERLNKKLGSMIKLMQECAEKLETSMSEFMARKGFYLTEGHQGNAEPGDHWQMDDETFLGR